MSLAAPTRRLVLATATAVLAATSTPAQSTPVITMLGDSITAGYGLPASEALPAQLQAALVRLGRPARVRGAGVSGDTTANGLSRVDFSVQPDTRLCIVALGGNDLLRGLDPAETRGNLTRIVEKLQRRHIRVMIVGLTAPPVIGVGYARDFDRVFPEVARTTGVELFPNLLAGVAGISALNQGDGIHPNPRGVAVIVSRLAPVVARSLARRG